MSWLENIFGQKPSQAPSQAPAPASVSQTNNPAQNPPPSARYRDWETDRKSVV